MTLDNSLKAFIFAGANASGKSTFITHLLKNEIIYGEYINPDLILKNDLKLEETKENYLRAFEVGEKRRKKALLERRDIIVETVFSTEEKIEYLKQLKAAGYHTTLFFTGTEDSIINAIYLLKRVQSGGHDVPLRKLLERREKGFANIKKVSSIADCLIFIDNSVVSEAPIVLQSLYNGKVCFTNFNAGRDLTWLSNLKLENLSFSTDEIKNEVPSEHFVFCEAIQNSTLTFSETLNMSYAEKNKVLNIEKYPKVVVHPLFTQMGEDDRREALNKIVSKNMDKSLDLK